MTNGEHKILRMLKQAVPSANAELRRDLWPMMQSKLNAQRTPVAWYDWALMTALGGVLALFPDIFLSFVYHL
jgi:hypothetical protein